MTIPHNTEAWNTVELDRLLEAATARALAKFPDARTRIERGAALVRADAVTDCTRCTPHGWMVASATEPGREYAVTSNGTTHCTCPDATRHDAWCKHAFAVLLTRAVRRDANKPRVRHGYHYLHGEGYALVREGGDVEYWPGGRRRSVLVSREDVTLGPVVTPAVWR